MLDPRGAPIAQAVRETPDLLANFDSGYTSFGIASLGGYAEAEISPVATSPTSISDASMWNAPSRIQAFGEAWDPCELPEAATAETDALAEGYSFLAEPDLFFPSSYREGDAVDVPGYFLRRIASGPVAQVSAPAGWGGLAAAGTSAILSPASPYLWNYGTPGYYLQGSSAPAMALGSQIPFESVGGAIVSRRAVAATTSLGTSTGSANIFRIASIRSVIAPFDLDPEDPPPDPEIFPFADDAALAGYMLDFGGPFSSGGSRERDSFMLIEAGIADPAGSGTYGTDPDRVFTLFGTYNNFETNSDSEAIIVPHTLEQFILPAAGDRLVYAAGDLDGLVSGTPDGGFAIGFQPGASLVDMFHVGAGLQAAFTSPGFTGQLPQLARPGAIRSFLPASSWTGLFEETADLSGLTASPVMVVHPAAPMVDISGLGTAAPGTITGDGADSRILQLDFGLATEGGRQISSISATVGAVDYRLYLEEQARGISLGELAFGDAANGLLPYYSYSIDALVSAGTVGSSSAGDGTGSVLWQSSWASAAAGGGNPQLGSEGGRLGFFLIQNDGTPSDDIAAATGTGPAVLEGGRAQPLGPGDGTAATLASSASLPSKSSARAIAASSRLQLNRSACRSGLMKRVSSASATALAKRLYVPRSEARRPRAVRPASCWSSFPASRSAISSSSRMRARRRSDCSRARAGSWATISRCPANSASARPSASKASDWNVSASSASRRAGTARMNSSLRPSRSASAVSSPMFSWLRRPRPATGTTRWTGTRWSTVCNMPCSVFVSAMLPGWTV